MRWMLDPLRINSQTRMTQFAQEGETNNWDYYDGNAVKQFEAIWEYLLRGDELKPPEE